jgi:hypothetical protein
MDEGLAAFIGSAVGVVIFLFALAVVGQFHFGEVVIAGVLGTGTYQALKD